MIYTVYARESDMTFIMEETEQGNSTKIEVKGFYYGEPNDICTKTYYGHCVAAFPKFKED